MTCGMSWCDAEEKRRRLVAVIARQLSVLIRQFASSAVCSDRTQWADLADCTAVRFVFAKQN